MSISSRFTEHPAQAGQTYVGHLKFAMGITLSLLKAAVACFTHAIYPPLHENTASKTIADLNNRIEEREISELVSAIES